jgi:quercetin dioxygenase-like cupin family protein
MGQKNTTEHGSSAAVFSPQSEQMRPSNTYLTSLSLPENDYCVITGKLPVGAVVPLHSHSDRETFYILSGEMNLYDGASWRILKQGDCVDVLSNTKHAWRNASTSSATVIVVTTVRMGVFLKQASTQREQFFKLVQEYGYWLGSPEDNEAIGLSTDWQKAPD